MLGAGYLKHCKSIEHYTGKTVGQLLPLSAATVRWLHTTIALPMTLLLEAAAVVTVAGHAAAAAASCMMLLLLCRAGAEINCHFP
jgi:hypothetical protein